MEKKQTSMIEQLIEFRQTKVIVPLRAELEALTQRVAMEESYLRHLLNLQNFELDKEEFEKAKGTKKDA
jgi:hypothetical protein